MASDVSLYFSSRVSTIEIAKAIENEFLVFPDVTAIHHILKRFEGDFDRDSGYIQVNDKDGISYSSYFYQYNHIFGGMMNGSNLDTLSCSDTDVNRAFLKRIAKYFGGWISNNDEDYEFVPKSESELEFSNEDKLKNLVFSKISYQNGEKLLKFIKANKEKLIEYNFGI